MAYSIKYQLFRIAFALLPGGSQRSKWVSEKKIFRETGANIYFQPRKLPADPELIKLHNNITIASGVTFITHDVFRLIFNNMGYEHNFGRSLGCIEIMDNVAIGSNSIILPDVRIGPNAIVGAGSIVTKDVPEGKIVAGNPAKVIGKFDDLVLRRINSETKKNEYSIDDYWIEFHNKRQN